MTKALWSWVLILSGLVFLVTHTTESFDSIGNIYLAVQGKPLISEFGDISSVS